MSFISENIFITNITKVKLSQSGRLQVTFVGYKTKEPTINDMVYMFTIPINHPALKSLCEQLKMKEDPGRRMLDESLAIPNGIEVNVKCESIEANKSPSVKQRYLNRITWINYVNEIFNSIEMEVPARQIKFYDWGIVIEYNDMKNIPIHNLVFYKESLPFKPSSMMDCYKKITTSDSIIIKGTVKVKYSNYRDDQGIWRVRQRYLYDSLIDKPVTIIDNLENLKNIYANKLRDFWKNPSFESFIKKVKSEWNEGFVSEDDIAGDANKLDMELDTSLLSTIFFKEACTEDKVFNYLKSLFQNCSSTAFYHLKNGSIPYIMLYDSTGYNLVVHDVKMAKIYILYCAQPSQVERLGERIVASTGIGIRRTIDEDSHEIKITTDIDLNSFPETSVWLDLVKKNLRSTYRRSVIERPGMEFAF